MDWTYGGVNILDRAGDKYSFITHNPLDPGSLSSNKIRTLALDSSGFIWIGTESDGMNRLDRTTGKITRYLHVRMILPPLSIIISCQQLSTAKEDMDWNC